MKFRAAMITKKRLLCILVTTIAFSQITGCSKKDKPEVQINEAEGRLIGYHPCVGDNTITTSRGKGKAYLVATTGANPDTLMVYGVPVGMFDIPDQRPLETNGFFFTEALQQHLKIRFSYHRSAESAIGDKHMCRAVVYLSPVITKYFRPEYIVVRAEKIE